MKQTPKAKGAADGTPGPGRGNKTRSDHPTTFSNSQPTLAELGISKQQSSDWQKLAEVPQEQFEARLNDTSLDVALGQIPVRAAKIPRMKFNQLAHRGYSYEGQSRCRDCGKPVEFWKPPSEARRAAYDPMINGASPLVEHRCNAHPDPTPESIARYVARGW